MRALVTGAQGFIGRYLVAKLLDEGADVIGVGRSEERMAFTHTVTWQKNQVPAPLPKMLARAFRSPRYQYFALDLADRQSLTVLLERHACDVIYHLAGALRDAPINALVRSNILASHALFEACAGLDRRPRIILGSSGSVVGPTAERDLPVAASRLQAIAPVDEYAATKRTAEDLAVISTKRHGLQVSTGRIFAVVGPGQEERHLCGHLARQFAERGAGVSQAGIDVGPLTVTRDFVDVRDVADALVLLGTTHTPPDLCNIASGRETATADVFYELKALTEDSSTLAPTKPERKTELGRSYADISHLSDLGFSPGYSLRQSLADLVEWYIDDVSAAALQIP